MQSSLEKLTQARQWLAEVKTMEDVKHIIDIAEAARVYSKAAKLGLEAQNEAAEIKIRAERKAGEMLAQLDHGQNGGDRKSDYQADNLISEFQEIIQEQEISKPTAYRWQKIATIPDEVFEETIIETKEQKEELTSAAMLRVATNKPHVSNNSGENEWYTPPEYIASARAVMGRIDIDPASSDKANEIVKASRYHTKQDDGLSQIWAGKVWMNPPYAIELIKQFITKYAEYVTDGYISEGIVLVNNATETNWFDTLVSVSDAIVFTKGRVRFLDPQGNPGAPLQGQAIVYSGKNPDGFLSEFLQFGWGARL